jgi:hypothetical protein
MKPGNIRHLAYAYGLNTLSREGQGEESRLALTVGGDFRPEREFTVTAYLRKSQAGQVVRLTLPPDLDLVPDTEVEQRVDRESDFSQVSWRVRAKAAHDYVLEATSAGARVTTTVKIRSKTIY